MKTSHNANNYRMTITLLFGNMVNELCSLLQTRHGQRITDEDLGGDSPAIRNDFADYAETVTGVELRKTEDPDLSGLFILTDEDPDGFPAEALGIKDMLKIYESCFDAVSGKAEEPEKEVLVIRTDLGGDITYKKMTCRDRKHAADEVRKHQELLETAGKGPFHYQPLCPGADVYVNDDETASFEVTVQKVR